MLLVSQVLTPKKSFIAMGTSVIASRVDSSKGFISLRIGVVSVSSDDSRKALLPRELVLLVSQVSIPYKGFVAKGILVVSVPSVDS